MPSSQRRIPSRRLDHPAFLSIMSHLMVLSTAPSALPPRRYLLWRTASGARPVRRYTCEVFQHQCPAQQGGKRLSPCGSGGASRPRVCLPHGGRSGSAWEKTCVDARWTFLAHLAAVVALAAGSRHD